MPLFCRRCDGRVTQALLRWYAANARDLPFRRIRDPYAIWVSEIMAQQTRIAALLPYYERFMARFPTPAQLAAASQDEVLAFWAGLGYYARARALHKAAQHMAESGIPSDYQGWRALPGVGDYTAAAIASIAFGQPTPAVDGNVMRVFARLTCFGGAEKDGKKEAGRWVAGLMAESDVWPGEVTQALMELGALVCLPQTPHCADCPVFTDCEACKANRVDELPYRAPSKPKRIVERDVLVVLDGQNRVLLRKRTERLLHNLFEFPAGLESITPVSCRALGEAEHVFTHIIWKMKGFLWRVDDMPAPEGLVWVTKEEWDTKAVPTAFRQYIRILQKEW